MNTLARICLMAFCALPALSVAAPMGYSVNSDQSPGDQLHLIDLETGQSTVRGTVFTGAKDNRDVEGLAFDRNGTLWAVDEWEFMLFPIQPLNGVGDDSRDKPIGGLEFRSGNDFGMTFTCDDELFISSVAAQKLYRLSTDTGMAVEVGDLGARIGALAAWGKNPTQLYGLGVGQYGDPPVVGNRSLYLIDTDTGAAELVGELGSEAAPYFEGGLSFDEEGQLWAITDRYPLGNQVFTLDLITGKATLVSTTVASGFESLAIAGPGGCEPPPLAPRGALNSIPTIDAAGRALATLLLLLTGLAVLRRGRLL